MKNIIIVLVLMLGFSLVSGQNIKKDPKTTELGSKNSNESIAFPTSLEVLKKMYGDSYEEIPDESTGANYYQWVFDEGIILVFVPLSTEDQYIGIVSSYEKEEPISGLPLGLIFNQTTFEEGKKLFASNNMDWKLIPENDSSYYKISFQKDHAYYYLYFYQNSEMKEVLKAITISTLELD